MDRCLLLGRAVECVGENENQKKRQDMEKLIKSIFGAEVVVRTTTANLLECYANNLDSVTEVHSLLCGSESCLCEGSNNYNLETRRRTKFEAVDDDDDYISTLHYTTTDAYYYCMYVCMYGALLF